MSVLSSLKLPGLAGTTSASSAAASDSAQAMKATAASGSPSEKTKEKFQEFVAGTFYRSLIEAMEKTAPEKTLVHGGRAEEIFRSHLNQTLAERFAHSHGSSVAGDLYAQFLRQLGQSVESAGGEKPSGVEGVAPATPGAESKDSNSDALADPDEVLEPIDGDPA